MDFFDWFKIDVIYKLTAGLESEELTEVEQIQLKNEGLLNGDDFEKGEAYINLGLNPIKSLEPRCFVPKGKQYKKYFTEKILDCFATGTVPIYWGAPDINKYFDISSILLVDETSLDTLSKDFYYDNIESIKFNFEQAKKIEILEDFIYNTYLNEMGI